MKVFFPDSRDTYCLVQKVRPQGVATQMLMGHGASLNTCFALSVGQSSSCICDPAQEQSVLCIIFEFSVFETPRHEAEQRFGLQLKKEGAHLSIKNKEKWWIYKLYQQNLTWNFFTLLIASYMLYCLHRHSYFSLTFTYQKRSMQHSEIPKNSFTYLYFFDN